MTDNHTTNERKTIDIGTVDGATELVFASTSGRGTAIGDWRYILQAEAEDYLATLARFPKHQITRTTNYYIDDCDGSWFAVMNVDCFDPPFAIIRARSLESALESFEDEFERWIAVSDVDAVDYPEDDRRFNNNGTHIDTDNVQIIPLTLVSIAL